MLYGAFGGVWPAVFGTPLDDDASVAQRTFIAIMNEYLAARSTAADGLARRRINNRYHTELARAALAVREWRGTLANIEGRGGKVAGLTIAIGDGISLRFEQWPPRWDAAWPLADHGRRSPTAPPDRALVRGDRVAAAIEIRRIEPRRLVFSSFTLRAADWSAAATGPWGYAK